MIISDAARPRVIMLWRALWSAAQRGKQTSVNFLNLREEERRGEKRREEKHTFLQLHHPHLRSQRAL